MKKFLFFLVVLLSTLTAQTVSAQVYDGITQPTTWRIWMPVTISTKEHSSASVAPFVGYKYNVCDNFNVTGVAQYNIGTETFTPQVWLNAGYKNFWFLTRNIVDTKTGKYSNTISATYKLPAGFHIDATWFNFYNDKFCQNDRLQVLGGLNIKNKVIVNSGYQFKGSTKGYVGNVRWKITDTQWLQIKYDHGVHQLNVAMAMHFN